jgi:uncharacterized protein YbjT (DUF2867 family)
MPDTEHSPATSPPRLGIIGAAGQTGRAVLAALARRGAPATAFVHRLSQTDDVRASGATEVATIELANAEELPSALAGYDALYVIPPVFHPAEDALVAHVVRAAQAAGVRQVVLHSVLHPWTPGLPHHQRKAEAEAALRSSCLEWTILRPAMYAQTVGFYVRRDTDEVLVPYSLSAPFTVIDVYDIAEVAATVLLEKDHTYATYELAGAERLSMDQMVDLAGEAVGRPLIAKEAAAWEIPVPASWSRHQFATCAAMWSHYDAHGLVGHPGTARALLGRPPSTFAEAFGRA